MDTESKAASERDDDSHKSKPWAACVLGYNIATVRLWPSAAKPQPIGFRVQGLAPSRNGLNQNSET